MILMVSLLVLGIKRSNLILHLGKQYMLTGGNDSNLFLWEDVTKEEELKKKEEEHEVLIQ